MELAGGALVGKDRAARRRDVLDVVDGNARLVGVRDQALRIAQRRLARGNGQLAAEIFVLEIDHQQSGTGRVDRGRGGGAGQRTDGGMVHGLPLGVK
ncbi:hypothetical protein G6F68_017910 [Rhizopus microsporus]|nr:hypothetical protein G6F68_017910 [Rhizopus microsporus]